MHIHIYIYIYICNDKVINTNCLSFDDPFLASKKYQEYKQLYENELTPSQTLPLGVSSFLYCCL